MSEPSTGQAGEAFAAAVAGAALGALVTWPLGIAPVGAAIGAANGLISGWRGVYEWRHPRGVLSFALDSTWALATTGAGVVIHGLDLVSGDPGYAPALSRRANRHVYRRGFQLRRGFAMTWGNVVNGAGEVDGDDAPAPCVAGGWSPTTRTSTCGRPGRSGRCTRRSTSAGPWSAARPARCAGRCGATTRSAGSVDAWGYYANPFEWWAYSRDGNWPPRSLRERSALVWRKPMTRPLHL